MKLSTLKISKPFIQYNVLVSHYVTRKTTAIEWAILESIYVCAANKNFAESKCIDIFEDVLLIKEADRIVKPVLLDLIGNNMVIIEGNFDDIDLSKLSMKDLTLTDKGNKLRDNGLLPGSIVEDVVKVYYDVINKKIVEHSVKLRENCTGIKQLELNKSTEVDFPLDKIKKYINQSKKIGKYNWLSRDSTIDDISEIDSKIWWTNSIVDINIDNKLNCSIDCDIDKKFIKDIIDNINVVNEDLTTYKNKTLQKNILSIDFYDNLNKNINKELNSSGIFFIRKKIFEELIKSNIEEIFRNRFFIVFDANTNEFKDKNYYFINWDLEPGLYFASSDKSIYCNNYSLNFGDIKVNSALSSTKDISIDKLMNNLINYKSDDYNLMFLKIIILFYLRKEEDCLNIMREIHNKDNSSSDYNKKLKFVKNVIKKIYMEEKERYNEFCNLQELIVLNDSEKTDLPENKTKKGKKDE